MKHYLFSRKSKERERKGDREFSIHWFFPQMASRSSVDLGWIWEPRASSGFPLWVTCFQTCLPPSSDLPGTLTGSWIKSGAANNRAAVCDPDAAGKNFTYYVTMFVFPTDILDSRKAFHATLKSVQIYIPNVMCIILCWNYWTCYLMVIYNILEGKYEYNRKIWFLVHNLF